MAPAPPKWPEEVFGKIDRQKAARGKILFADNCAGCHNSYPYTWTEPNKYGKRFLQVGLLPAAYMGTDKQQLLAVKEFMITGELSAYLPPPYTGEAVVPRTFSRQPLRGGLLKEQWNLSS